MAEGAPAPGQGRAGRVVVVGSLNMDLVVRTPRLPRPGETVVARSFATFPGGKGANQAVAAARMGAGVAMVGRVGGDSFGEVLRRTLEDEGVDVRWLRVSPQVSTGVASIWVDEAGTNTIAIVAGANGDLSPQDVEESSEALARASAVLLQMEIPVSAIEAALETARRARVPVILDPAPVDPRAGEWLGRVWAVAPNQVEAEALVGFTVRSVADGARAARELVRRGACVGIVKMAEQGVVVASSEDGRAYHCPAVAVEAVDTTAAGDAFCGAFAAAWCEGLGLLDACRLANVAAGLSTTRPGAQPSLPRRDEVEAFLARRSSPEPRPVG